MLSQLFALRPNLTRPGSQGWQDIPSVQLPCQRIVRAHKGNTNCKSLLLQHRIQVRYLKIPYGLEDCKLVHTSESCVTVLCCLKQEHSYSQQETACAAGAVNSTQGSPLCKAGRARRSISVTGQSPRHTVQFLRRPEVKSTHCFKFGMLFLI